MGVCSVIEQTMTDATRRVTHWMIGIRGEVPLVEELATAEDVHSFVCGHVRWLGIHVKRDRLGVGQVP
jgi:hypothetical protein